MLGQPLQTDPGAHYAYSNFGYCLLGRVLEKVTGQSYEQAVKDLILDPADTKSMTIGGNTKQDRLPNEVLYYGQDEDAYHKIMDVKRMDAHGGWVATPIDLVRFALHIGCMPRRQ